MIIDIVVAILSSLCAIFVVVFSYYGFAVFFYNKLKKRKEKKNEIQKNSETF